MQSRDDFSSLRTNLEEKDRLLSDKDAKLLLQQSEIEDLKRENDSLRGVIAQYKEKHARLQAQLKDLSSSVRKSSADKEEMSRTIKTEIERRYKEELETLEHRKQSEIAELRSKISSESSQSFAAQVQRMTAEHDATVSKLMDALMDKQRQEQKLIALVNKEQEECRRLRMDMAMRTVPTQKQDSEISIPRLALPLDSERDSSAVLQGTSLKEESLQLDEEKKQEDLVSDGESLDEFRPELSKRTHTRSHSSPIPPAVNAKRDIPRSPSLSDESDDKPEPSSRPIPTSPHQEQVSNQSIIPRSVSPQPSLLPVLTFVFLRMQTKLKVMKLDRAGKAKVREIWVERLEQFLGTREGPNLWTQALSSATVRWSTTSRFKREVNLCFRLCHVDETGANQQSPGFQKNSSLSERGHLSLWARYRSTGHFEVIFDDRQSLVVWSAGLKLGQLALNNPSPDFKLWRQEYGLLVAECAMAEA